MEWPKDETTGKVSTTVVNKRIWKAFLSPLVKHVIVGVSDISMTRQLVQDANEICQALDELPDREWRHRYASFVNSIIQIQARATPEEALHMCQAGLDAAHNIMRFVTTGNDGVPSIGLSANDAVLQRSDPQKFPEEDYSFDSLVLYGKKPKNGAAHMEWKVPASTKNPDVFRTIQGETVNKQLQALVDYGCMEPSAASAASEIMVQKTIEEISESLKDKVFVLLGATSELGPALPLAQLGATIVAVARPGQKLQALIEEIQENTDAVLILPVKTKKMSDVATTMAEQQTTVGENEPGADLIHDTPQLARWITSLYPQKQLVIMSLAYLDGEANVRAVTAMDLIIEFVIQQRDRRNSSVNTSRSATRTALAFLISPGTPHVISEEAAKNAIERYDSSSSSPVWHSAFRFLPTLVGGFSKYCITDPPLPPHNFRVYNGLAEMQGPNYALSKCMQQWRAMLAHSQGHCVSANISPPAKTQSMISHSQVATWLEGVQTFPPMVAFDPSMARSLMASLLVWDVTSPCSAASQNIPHPVMLFLENSVHGGVWRFPYDINSVGLVSFMIGKILLNKGLPPKEIVVLEETD